jgi:hypothetical protein
MRCSISQAIEKSTLPSIGLPRQRCDHSCGEQPSRTCADNTVSEYQIGPETAASLLPTDAESTFSSGEGRSFGNLFMAMAMYAFERHISSNSRIVTV